MRKKSPVSVERIRFYTYERYEETDRFFITEFPYDDRHDFVVNEFLTGIAAKLEIYNDRETIGVRRKISLSLVDLTSRCEVASQIIKVNIPKGVFSREICVDFPVETTAFTGGHTYKLSVNDATSSVMLAESVFHLFDLNTLGDPMNWYEIITGGIRSPWESGTYKVLQTKDDIDYYVRFTLTPKFGEIHPPVLPELEMRLYFPEGKRVTAQFKEPKYFGIENFKDNILTLDFPFSTDYEPGGIFYAELLCMEYPVAGFVFDTRRNNTTGAWCGDEIQPLDEYSPEAAAERLNSLLPDATEETSGWTDQDFEDLINDFINSQQKEDESEPEDESKSDSESDDDATESDSDKEISEIPAHPSDDCPGKSLLSSLEHLTGLHHVKEKLRVYENVVRFNKRRSDCGLPTTGAPLHAMFLGSPGTGKTTVAKMMGLMLRRAGVLSKGHVVVRERATLIGPLYSSEAEKTLAAIEEARGGILFIDEAYQLYQPHDPRDPGKCVIDSLLTALADDSRRDWMLILAGYPEEMRRMFEMNPGLRSRIPESNIYTFDDFTEPELMEIAQKYFTRHHYSLTHGARDVLSKRLTSDYTHREKNFGNARHVINLIQTEILPSMAVRVISEGLTDDTALTEIQETDIPLPASKPQSSLHRVGFSL